MSSSLPQFHKYDVLKQLAVGGMGTVYLARVASSAAEGRIVVLKHVSAEHHRNPEYRKLFEAEIRVMIGLSHPNVVTLLDVDEENGALFITLEWIEGKSVRDVFAPSEGVTTIPLTITLDLVLQAAQGLQYAHHYVDRTTGRAQPIVHRDVTPSNLIVGYDGRLKVIDFGISAAVTGAATSIPMGKASYMAPEQYAGRAIDPRTDVFGLGIVLWEMLTRKKLFTGETEAHTIWKLNSEDFPIPLPSSYAVGIPPLLDEIVRRALQRDPKDRIPSMDVFANSLRKVLRQMDPDFTSEKTVAYLQNRYGGQIAAERQELQRLLEENANGAPRSPLASPFLCRLRYR